MSLINRLIVGTMPLVPKFIVRRVADPYIAGESLEEMARSVESLNEKGCKATVDVLGEFITCFEQAEETAKIYHQVLELINEKKLNSGISIKLTAFGFNLDESRCEGLVRGILDEAKKRDIFVRFDMESSHETERTLEFYHHLLKDYPWLGIVIQAYLRQTMNHMDQLIEAKGNIRLCKGIYIEPPHLAYKEDHVVRQNFTDLLDRWMGEGLFVGIATHDETLVQKALTLLKKHNPGQDKYEFQMLLGVAVPLRKWLIANGHPVRVYVPFGADWYGYSTRRLKENPQVARYVLNDLLGGIFGGKKQ